MVKSSTPFSGFSVSNISEARKFYSETLGFEVKDMEMGILQLHPGGDTKIIIYPKKDHIPATFTILNFPVKNIDEAVDELISKGVVFEQYGGQISTDEKGIVRSKGNGPNIAWFKDPSGNILSFIEEK